ncbi:hypothetical protein [Mumia zhuanghuii]|uniref:Uncharacterized protein n=1 Tax=Mumia zhuanghuii TaxID=2585211 RepID=A0A5C4MIF6_9ACTN|nr:hypothetical protein [Mumia zhuanghuii]TNC39572.1 hypothetical protein FHE65_23825 [Mumia zhuanghuii]TNC47754.1 hypothetical protein FHE65_08810 [Mumia zhuanghuii]
MATSRKIPRQLRRAIEAEQGERVLAAQQDVSERWHVGTDAALHLAADADHVRVPWEQVESLSWDAEAATVTVQWGAGDAIRRDVVAFADSGRLVELARERVDASIIARADERVGDGRDTVTVVARRSPARRGPITYSYVLDQGLSSDDVQVQEAAARALASVQDDLGVRGRAGADGVDEVR